MDVQQVQAPQTPQVMEDVQGPSDSSIADKTRRGDETTVERPTYMVHLEVRLKTHSTARADLIKQLVHKHVSADQQLYVPGEISGWQSEPRLAQNVHRIMACETSCPTNLIDVARAELEIHVYQPMEAEAADMTTGKGGDDVVAATVTDLPCVEWDNLWDSLIYDDDVKPKLLNYLYTTFLFSDADVDFNLVAWNRVVLLHGPPGTGKTSLCKALAQKLAIRLSDRYGECRLLEINSHSLFSKWFSESGKLVQKIFTNISEMADEDDVFLVILLDEVESLTAARAGAVAGREPSDALRVVNALLTQLDKLKHRKNVLIMSTSNLPSAIDAAFRDRADIVQYIGLPPTEAIFDMLRGSLVELIRKGIVAEMDIPDRRTISLWKNAAVAGLSEMTGWKVPAELWNLAELCKGLSGRALRRLPVLAHARSMAQGRYYFVPKKSTSTNGATTKPHRSLMPVEHWLKVMETVVVEQKKQLELLT